eukprot:GFYU01014337.1.p1 GENE.GFYU01014337.1~~GFYU01014337.1.p1  ORF type:complete len:158 (+),score=34.06 GFYU01014337.1:129-602(+)
MSFRVHTTFVSTLLMLSLATVTSADDCFGYSAAVSHNKVDCEAVGPSCYFSETLGNCLTKCSARTCEKFDFALGNNNCSPTCEDGAFPTNKDNCVWVNSACTTRECSAINKEHSCKASEVGCSWMGGQCVTSTSSAHVTTPQSVLVGLMVAFVAFML